MRLTLGRASLCIYIIGIGTERRALVRPPSSIFELYEPWTEPQLYLRWTWFDCAGLFGIPASGKSPQFCEPVNVAKSWRNFPVSSAEKIRHLRKHKNFQWFWNWYFLRFSLILLKSYKKCHFTKFYFHSGPIVLKLSDNTGRRANKSRQTFLQAHFKGKQTNALVSVS